MYEKSGMIKKAAALYIEANNLSKAEPLVHTVSDTETYKAFANAKEQGKQFNDALEAYKLSGARLSNHLSLCTKSIPLQNSNLSGFFKDSSYFRVFGGRYQSLVGMQENTTGGFSIPEAKL